MRHQKESQALQQEIQRLQQELESLQLQALQQKAEQDQAHGLIQHMINGYAELCLAPKPKVQDLIFVQANEVFARQCNRQAHELIGQGMCQTFPALLARRSQVVAQCHQVAKEGGSFRTEVHSKPLNRWFSLSVFQTRPGHIGMVCQELTSQRLAEEELFQSKERYEASFNQSQVGLVHLDLDFQITEVNPKFCKLLQREAPQLLGTNLKQLIHPEDLQAQEEGILKLLHHQDSLQKLELRMQRPDGSLLWMAQSLSLIQNSQGEGLYFIAVCTNISSRKQAEGQLRESHLFLKHSLDSLESQIAILDGHGQILSCNKAWREKIIENQVFQACQEPGCNLLEQLSAVQGESWEMAQSILQRLAKLKKTRLTQTLDYVWCQHEGAPQWLALRMTYFEQGGEVRLVLSQQDITFRKDNEVTLAKAKEQAEQLVKERTLELQAGEIRFRALFQNMGNGVLVLRSQGPGKGFEIQDLNWSAERLLDLDFQTLSNRDLLSAWPEIKDSNLWKAFLQVENQGGTSHQTFGQRGGHQHQAWQEHYIYKLPTGELVSIFEDVTERKKAEEKIAMLARFPAENPNPVLRITKAGRILYANQASEELMASWQGKKGQRIKPEVMNQLRRVIETGIAQKIEMQAQEKVYSLLVSPVKNEEAVYLYGEDITEHKRAEEKILLASKVFENSGEGIIITDRSARILEVNQAFCRISGYSREELIGNNPSLMRSGKHDVDFYQELWGSLLNQGHWQGEIWDRRKNGAIFPKLLSINSVTNREGKITNFIGISTDITAMKETEEGLEKMAHFDPLTGLANRILFRDRLEHALMLADRQQKQVALMFLDLDRFKQINDNLGHKVGDELLKEVAHRLQQVVRKSDTVARMGGDEFTVIAPELNDAKSAGTVAAKIIERFNDPFMVEGNELLVTSSLGIALYPHDASDIEELLKCSDKAMYFAKEQGKNNYQFFSTEMNHRTQQRNQMEFKLNSALQEGQMELYFQPVVSALDGKLVCMEALLRWRSPGLGLLEPLDFLPLAEETGLINPIGNWVLEQACRQAGLWKAQGFEDFRIAVNLSAVQFR